MTGSSFFDYIHQGDHAELCDLLGINASNHGGHHSSSSSSLHHSIHSSSPSPLPPPSVGSNASSDSESGHYHSGTVSIMTSNGPNDTYERQFCVRMKSTLTKRGCQHFKSSGYRCVHVISHLRPEHHSHGTRSSSSSSRDNYNHNSSSNSNLPKIMGLVGVAIALPPPSVNELRLEPDMFVVRLGLDFKILHVEPRYV